MAQILKFQTGGVIKYGNNKIQITQDIINRYKEFGDKYNDQERAAFMHFYNQLNNGLTDPNVQITIDPFTHSISGIDWNGDKKDPKALSRDQNLFGEIITQMFRPTVKGIKKVAYDLTQYNPQNLNPDYTNWMADNRIDLTHKFDHTTGNIDKNNFVENSDESVKKAKNRLLFFGNIENEKSPVKQEDTISGYNNITKKDIIDKVKTITNVDEWINRLFDGTYTSEDEALANYFGIFFDNNTQSDRERVANEYQQNTEFNNKFNSSNLPNQWKKLITFDNDTPILNEDGKNLINEIRTIYNIDSTTPLWLNDLFFALSGYEHLKPNDPNGLFIFGDKIYNGSNPKWDESDRATFNRWVAERRNNEGDSNIIKHDWYSEDIENENPTDTYYIPGISELFNDGKFYGAHVPYLIDDGKIVYRVLPQGWTYDDFGTPSYQYWSYDPNNGEFKQINDPVFTSNYTSPYIPTNEYTKIGNNDVYYLGNKNSNWGDTQHQLDWYYFKGAGEYGFGEDGTIHAMTNDGREIDIKDLNGIYYDELWKWYINNIKNVTQMYKTGGKIQKFQNGKTIGENYDHTIPFDLIAGGFGWLLSNKQNDKYYDKLKEAYKEKALGELPVKKDIIYPIYSNNGLTQQYENAKRRILSAPTAISSDPIANMKSEIYKHSLLAQQDIAYNTELSKSIAEQRNKILNIRQQEAEENAKHASMNNKIWAGIRANNLQIESEKIKKKGENTQKLIEEIRKRRDLELNRRAAIEDKVLEYGIDQRYKQILYEKFSQLDEANRQKWESEKTTYNNNIYEFMKANFPDISTSAMNTAMSEYLKFLTSSKRNLFPMAPTTITIGQAPNGVSTGVEREIPEIATSNKKGGKLEYIKSLYKNDIDNNLKLLKSISK